MRGPPIATNTQTYMSPPKADEGAPSPCKGGRGRPAA